MVKRGSPWPMMFPDGAWCARRRIDLAAFMLAALGAKGPALHGTPGVRLNPFCAEECFKVHTAGRVAPSSACWVHDPQVSGSTPRSAIACLPGPARDCDTARAMRSSRRASVRLYAPDHVNAIAIGRYSMHPALALFQTWPWSRAPLLSGIAESSGKPGGASATASSSLRAA